MTSRTVEYAEFGPPSVLKVVETAVPTAGPGQARVRVRAAGINPFDHKVFTGSPLAAALGVTLPAGNGSDFAGVVDQVGEGVTGVEVGDEVLGRTGRAQATYVLADADALVAKPAGVSFETAAALPGVGLTAWAGVESLQLTADDVVLVSAAAGGVGVLAAQLARRAGATVIGTASQANHAFLESLGVIPLEYGDGLAERVRAAAPAPITAVLDNHGRATIDAALELGVPASRINTIADMAYAAEIGAATVGAFAAGPTALADVVALVAAGELTLPIDSMFPLERVSDAYDKLIAGHVRGKIVLTDL